jgi:Holliday junction resolvase RusA-like endonuclease
LNSLVSVNNVRKSIPAQLANCVGSDPMYSYWIDGEPAPQGSKNGFVKNGRVVMVESSKKVKPWREAVATATQEYRASKWPMAEQWTLTTPVEIALVFHLPRPKSVNRKWPSVKPDLDKLIRSTFDGLTTGGLYTDDALVIAVSASKQYATDRIGCQVIASEVLDV